MKRTLTIIAACFLAIGTAQAGWLQTGGYIHADAAERIAVDGDAEYWLGIHGGTATVWRVENTSNVYVTATSGAGYNGPAVGTVFSEPSVDVTQNDWHTSAWVLFAYPGEDFFSGKRWVLFDKIGGLGNAFDSGSVLTMPGTVPAAGDGVGTLTIDWQKSTNSYPLASVSGLAQFPTTVQLALATNALWIATANAIAEHNTNTASHADIRAAIADAPTWGVTNQLLYLDAGSVTGMVFRMGATNIYLWQVQP